MVLRDVAQTIIDSAIRSSLPDEAVKRALKNCRFEKKVHLVAIGKAAWQMARAAVDCIGSQIQDGIVITKYGHIKKEIPGLRLFEAGHKLLQCWQHRLVRLPWLHHGCCQERFRLRKRSLPERLESGRLVPGRRSGPD